MGYGGKERNSLKISSPKIIVELGGIKAVVLHENQFFPYINSSLRTERTRELAYNIYYCIFYIINSFITIFNTRKLCLKWNLYAFGAFKTL
jgi:hypothetical protein